MSAGPLPCAPFASSSRTISGCCGLRPICGLTAHVSGVAPVERVLDVDVGAAIEQQLHDVEMAAVARERERRRAVAKLRVDVDALVEQLLDGRGVPLACRVGQRLGLRVRPGPRIRTAARGRRRPRGEPTPCRRRCSAGGSSGPSETCSLNYFPPATSMNAPVVYEASSDRSQRMAAATSRGLPPRFIGTSSLTRSTRLGSPPLA